jgi:hypothetical protein
VADLNICQYKIQKMSDVIEDNIEAIEDVVEEKDVVKKKKPYVLSPLRLEALAKAREKAFSLRKEFHDNKEPRGKKEKIKKKSKLEVELENRELKAVALTRPQTMVLDHPQVDEDKVNGDGSGSPSKVVDEKVVDEKVVEKVVDEGDGSGSPPVVEKVVDAYSAFPNGNDKVEVVEKVVEGDGFSTPSVGGGSPPVKARPSFVRNENGFFCINMLI